MACVIYATGIVYYLINRVAYPNDPLGKNLRAQSSPVDQARKDAVMGKLRNMEAGFTQSDAP